MKKKLFLWMLVLSGIINLSQAQLTVNPHAEPIKPAKVIAAADEIAWGYCDKDAAMTGVGSSSQITISAAIHVPSSQFGVFEGQTIKGMNIGVAAAVTGLKIFIRETLSGSDLYFQSIGNADAGWNEIAFTTPFTIPEGGFYIGYIATGKYHIGFSGVTYDGSCHLQDASGWKDYQDSDFGSLCIQAIVDVADFNKTDIGIISLNDAFGEIGSPFTTTGVVRNNTANTLSSFTFEYVINDGTPMQGTATCDVAAGFLGTYSFEGNSVETTTGTYPLKITVKEANGTADTYSVNNTATGKLEIFKYIYPKKVVVEEGTGTWCGWCPRGAVGLAKMKEQYPDSFIGIAVHQGDAMAVTSYINNLGFKSYPTSKTQRKTEQDPSFGNLEAAYLKEMAIPSQIGIEVEAELDPVEKKINITSAVTFGYDASNANYRIAYVVMENDVTGYTQTNYYAGGGSGPMEGWESKPNPAAVPFEDVARGIYSEFKGVPNSIPTTVQENVPVEHTYTIDLPSTIQDLNQLEVVAMLIKVSSGEIVNADKTHLEYDVTLVSHTPADNATDVAANTNITATLDVNISSSVSSSDLSKIVITPELDNVSASINGKTLTIKHDGLVCNAEHTVTIPAGTIKDYPEAISWSFTAEAPKVASFLPVEDVNNVQPSAEVTVTFNGVVGAADLSGITITPDPGNVSASLAGKVLTIAHDNFAYGTKYTVTVPAGAIKDYAETISWSFSTVKVEPTLLTPVNNAANVAINANVAATFTVNISGSDLSGITITPDPGNVSASIKDKVLTIAHNDFAYETDYTVTIPAATIDGCAEAIEWTFTTVQGVGIKDTSLNSVNIYPNPAKEVVHLNNLPENSTITLYDLSGRKINEYKASQTLDIQTAFESGIYLMKIEAEGKSIVRKLIIK